MNDLDYLSLPETLRNWLQGQECWLAVNDKHVIVIASSSCIKRLKLDWKENEHTLFSALQINHDKAACAALQSIIEESSKIDEPIYSKNLLFYPENAPSFGVSAFHGVSAEGSLTFVSLLESPAENQMAMQTREKLAITLRSISEGVITTNKDGLIELINPEASNITGWEQREAQEQPLSNILKLVSAKNHAQIPDLFEEIARTGLPVGKDSGILLINRDGKERTVRINTAPILDRAGFLMGSVTVFEDIALKSRLELELQKIQRMNSLSLLSAGIAHDFNNYLTSIMGNLSLARNKVQPEDKLYSILLSAEKGTKQAKYLTDRLFSFSKGSTPIKTRCNLSLLVDDIAEFILNGSKCTYKVNSKNKIWGIEADEGQISQVLNNLLINAIQALPDGGHVEIDIANVNRIWDPGLNLENGPYVCIKIQDNGNGIAPELMNKLFEPYFTTKQNGTGLGLATTYSIIKNHRGHIEVQSTVGEGTVFSIYLPAEPNMSLTNEREVFHKIYHGEGRILVIDDEEIIQQIICDMLEHLGYRGDAVEDGEKGMELLEDAKKKNIPYSAVVIDLSLGKGGDGISVLNKFRKYDPSMKAIISSGYAHSDEVLNFREYGFQGCIVKPYNIEQISWTMKSVLES